MDWVPVAAPPDGGPLPDEVTRLLAEAARRIDRFLAENGSRRVPAFVPSDFEAVARTLVTVRDRHLAPGTLFCEWGSGFGVVALTAALLGFSACGLEAEGELVRASRSLAADLHVPARFVEGSFVPEDLEAVADEMGDFAWLRTDVASGYEELGHDPDELDVIFAYPWPGEEQILFELFDRIAAEGALLLTWHGKEGVQLRRKWRPRRRGRRG